MEAIQAIMSRNSYRGKYLDTPVPEEDVRTIMEAGLAAPSGCNMQSTSLIGITDKALLRQLCEQRTPPLAETAQAAICVLTQRIPARGGKFYNVQDYAAAIENMLVAINALGYQSCWYEGRVTDTDEVGLKMAKVLGVPDDYQLVCFLPIGVAADEVVKPVKKPSSERAWLNGFGK